MDRERLRRVREIEKGRRQKDRGEGDRVTEWEGDRWKKQKKVKKKNEEEIEEETVQW
jgi:hypothetical protein